MSHDRTRLPVAPGATDAPAVDLPVVALRGMPLAAVTEPQLIRHVLDALAAGRGGWVVTANLDHLRRMSPGSDYRALCQSASVIVADGMPLIWASRLQGTPLPERVAGSSLVHSLSAAAAGCGRSLYLLGGEPGTAGAAATALQWEYPWLRIAGSCCPPYGFEKDEDALRAIARQLQTAAPDIVYVALGSPKQERLIAAFRRDGLLPGAWWMGVGISFSFLCGEVRRAPAWMQRIGLEWLHRLTQEPRRLARRYLLQGIPFALRLLAGAAWARLAGRRRESGHETRRDRGEDDLA